MRKLIEQLEKLIESSGSVQTGDAYLTYKQDGDRIDYVVWAKVLPYFGSIPAKDAIHVHMRGRSPDSFDDLMGRMKMTYGGRDRLMRFQGKDNEYPYTTKDYRGDTMDEIKKLRGYDTIKVRTGEKAAF